MANYKTTDSELISIATAIREKAGISKQLIFPTEFVSEIENIPSQAVSQKPYLCSDISTTPCIDTGVPCNTENLKVVTTFKLGLLINDRSIFGGAWSNTGFLLIIYNNTFRFHSKGQSLDIPTSVFNSANNMFDDITIECTKDYIKVNNNEYQITVTGNNSDSNLKIFTVDNRHYTPAIAFSSFKIYQNNILLRDFVPALTDNDVACFYDNVTKQYFYNTGGNELYYRTAGCGSSAVVQPLSVTVNGTYNPPTGVDGYAPVTVNVSGQEYIFDYGLVEGYTPVNIFIGSQSSDVSYNSDGTAHILGGYQNRRFLGFAVDLTGVSSIGFLCSFKNSNSTIGVIASQTIEDIANNRSGNITTIYPAYTASPPMGRVCILTLDTSALSGQYYVGLLGYEEAWSSDLAQMWINRSI